ncbi:MAG TPA: hypothetical protein VFT98_22825 [Myxococcota bacterium]|nr:hypothetical protein [Myxococcota bacterium]
MKAVLARGIATLIALALVVAAAYVWLRPSARTSRPGEDAVSAAPPQHDDISREDREALREILRDEDSR